MFVFNSLLGDFVSLVATLLVVLIIYFKWRFQHWSRRGVPFIQPCIPYGNFSKVLRCQEHISITLKKIYNAMKKKDWKYLGIFQLSEPRLVLADLDIIRNVLIKDFQHFADRGFYYNEKEALQAHLFNLSGTKWKRMKAKLTPVFTPAKIKIMLDVITECQKDLLKRMEKECQKDGPINIREISACFTTNVIGSAVFGLEFNALEDENSEFRIMGRKLLKLCDFKFAFAMTLPQVATLLDIYVLPRDVTDFMTHTIQKTIEYREENNVVKNDFMQMMINLKNKKQSDSVDDDGKPLTLDEVASQCLVFFGAGFETSSSLMTFALYELAKNQHIQDKLRNEINTVLEKHKDEINYDSIHDMTYLKQVIDECILRLVYSIGNTSNEEFIIEEGTNVIVPVLAIHHDEEIYPNPTIFDPERFSEENRRKRHNCAYLPFGQGPRSCIGMRFGLLQSKMGLVPLIKHYNFTIDKETQEPIVYKPKSIVLCVQGEVWLRAQKL